MPLYFKLIKFCVILRILVCPFQDHKRHLNWGLVLSTFLSGFRVRCIGRLHCLVLLADKYAALADLDNMFGGGAAVSWDGSGGGSGGAGGGGGGQSSSVSRSKFLSFVEAV